VLDTVSLRVAFGAVALTMLVLFYVVTYRSTRSSYCGWWCVSLSLFLLGSSAYCLDGTDQQVWANPLGNALVVLGAAAVWAGARSLRGATTPPPLLLTGPALVLVASALDDPADNDWSGGPFLLALTAAYVGLASAQLWRLSVPRPGPTGPDAGQVAVVRWLALMSGSFALFYLARLVVFVLGGGPDSTLFSVWFGSQATTLLTTVLLATVSFSMTTLSTTQETGELRRRADVDGLTGLLNRAAFTRVAHARLALAAEEDLPVSLIAADLDDFKDVNDSGGHAAGDRALRGFAAACRAAVRPDDVLGRVGGDEFVLLLPGASVQRCHEVAAQISANLRGLDAADGLRLPTISYGIASLDGDLDLEGGLARADAALYRAKAQGRDRSVHVGRGASRAPTLHRGREAPEAPEAPARDCA